MSQTTSMPKEIDEAPEATEEINRHNVSITDFRYWEPVADHLVIIPERQSEQSAGGVYVPKSSARKKVTGWVVAIGALSQEAVRHLTFPDGSMLRVYDRVHLMPMHTGTSVSANFDPDDDIDYYVLPYTAVMQRSRDLPKVSFNPDAE